MALNTYEGAGTSLGSKHYIRNFYVSNRDAGTSSKRSSFGTNTLSLADGMALRRAVKQLGSFGYDESQDASIRNSVLAYIDTYNNTLSSLSESSDRNLQRYEKQLKSLTEEYKDKLDKIGITVKEDGTLESRDSLFKSADISKFKELFSSDSSYMQRSSAYANRIRTRSESLLLTEQYTKNIAAKKASENTEEDSTDQTAAAQVLSQSVDLDTLLNTGIGGNVNIAL